MTIHHPEKDGDWYIYSMYYHFRIGPMVLPLMIGNLPNLGDKGTEKVTLK